MTTTPPLPLLDELDEAHRVWKEGGWGATAAALFTFPEAVPQLTAALRAVLALHRPFGIYTECDHDHDEADIENDLAFEVMEVGTVCEDGLMYRVCQSCCTGNGYQTEECVTYHKHSKDEPICPTVAALASPAPAPQGGES